MEISGYVDLREIGRGASATVYRARQVSLGRDVAIKVLSTTHLDEDARRRFDRECQAVGGLSWHPRVVEVFDAGVTPSGHPYLVMAYLSGASLAHRVHDAGPIPQQEVLSFGTHVADALDAAHRIGVLHRDVKPGNILVGPFGEAMLADFGIASLASAATATTQTLAGTLSFMAPELLEGARASAASDVYSLGATMYTLLTGDAPFAVPTGESPMAALRRIASEPLPDLRRKGVAAPVASLVQQATAKDPKQRIATAADLVAALHAAADRCGWDRQVTYAGRGADAEGEASAPDTPPDSSKVRISMARPRPVDTGLPPASLELPPGPVPKPRTAPRPEPPAPSESQLRVPVVERVRAADRPRPDEGATSSPPEAPVPPAAPVPEPAGGGRRRLLVGVVVLIAMLAVAGLAIALAGGDEGSSEDTAERSSASASGDRAERTPTTTVTRVQRTTTTTTTTPPVASARDIATANPAGSYSGLVNSTQCDFAGDDFDCNDYSIASISIRCPNTGCVASVSPGGWRTPTDVPLSFDGTAHVGSVSGVESGWVCAPDANPTDMTAGYELALRTQEAEFRDGAWATTVLAGTYVYNLEPINACDGERFAYDLILRRD